MELSIDNTVVPPYSLNSIFLSSCNGWKYAETLAAPADTIFILLLSANIPVSWVQVKSPVPSIVLADAPNAIWSVAIEPAIVPVVGAAHANPLVALLSAVSTCVFVPTPKRALVEVYTHISPLVVSGEDIPPPEAAASA